jgi:hypothetical protein
LLARLQLVVFYFNFLSNMAKKHAIIRCTSTKSEVVKKQASFGTWLSKYIISVNPRDLQFFLKILARAKAFSAKVQTTTGMYLNDGKVIATVRHEGDLYELREAFTEIGTLTLASRPQPVATHQTNKVPGSDLYYTCWCIKSVNWATQYAARGPQYFVDKNSWSYVALNFNSGDHGAQAKNVHNGEIGWKEAKEIAPLFVKDYERFPGSVIKHMPNAPLRNMIIILRKEKIKKGELPKDPSLPEITAQPPDKESPAEEPPD